MSRIIQVTDESGQESRAYDALGAIIEETKTVASDTQGGSGDAPEVWTTRYLYDTWGRLQQMAYPDSEVLTYSYDSGGLPRAATGEKQGLSFPYVTRLEYDRFEQRAFMEDGNGIRTRYTYDPADRRLFNLKTASFQNLTYAYDDVGNITSLSSDVAIPPSSQIGGPTSQSFQYDGLYRLTNAAGTWTQPGSKGLGDKSSRYTLGLDYDRTHNIQSKIQTTDQFAGSTKPNPIAELTYNFNYDYASPHPHAPTRIGDRTFTYDLNGNQTGWDEDQSNQRRRITWDEENRIQTVNDNGNETTYKYDDAGERVIKRTSQGETAYINQFWSVRNRSDNTKHIFVGATRVVSKLGTGNANTLPPTTATTSVSDIAPAQNQGTSAPNSASATTEQAADDLQGPTQIPVLPSGVFLYFYHPDHLGSTGYVTDNLGAPFQHVEYFPFGETWAEESSNKQRTPYLFTSKELDEETQLYYFGARYYDPRTSVWQSADPALVGLHAKEKRTGAGISRSLAAYSYAGANPLVRIDPDGRDIKLAPALLTPERAADRKMLLKMLQSYTQDKLMLRNGEILIVKTGAPNSGKERGTILIRRMIHSRNTATIDVGAFGATQETAVDGVKATTPGKGSDVTINFDPTEGMPVVVMERGTPKAKVASQKIGMVHELVHGYRDMTGRATPKGVTEENTYMDPRGRVRTETQELDELETMGVKGRGISENDIRREQGEPPRTSYETYTY